MTKEPGCFKSSIGLKLIMAGSGVLLLCFVIVHMLGNLQIFLGQEAFNSYAEFLKSKAGVLWGARLGLLVILILHVYTAATLEKKNRAARPEGYVIKNTVKASAASTTMLVSGTLILLYVLFHIAHFTVGVTHPEHFKLIDSTGRHDVYSMTVRGFQSAAVAWGYVLAMGVLFFHLSHAISSVFQTLGCSCTKSSCTKATVGKVVSGVIFLGFVSIPISVQLGIIKLPLAGGV